MQVKTKHPAMTAERLAEWQLMRDSMDGESIVKARGETHLKMPSGFLSNAATRLANYENYLSRAQFPEILAPSVAAMIGIIHGGEVSVEMPDQLAFLWEDADGEGLPLEAFHRRITRELLVTGRYAVLADAPESGGDPFLVGYAAEAVINWDHDFWVLDETALRREGFTWKQIERYRVLSLENGAYKQELYEGDTQAVEIPVLGLGGRRLNRIPFAIANARDLTPKVETPPLIGVSRAALAIYQLSADYRWQLYMSGQETLVAINGDAPSAVGAGVVHSMMGAEGIVPDLKYVSPTCSGIDAHERAMDNNRTAAVQAGARLLEQSDAVQESGEARKLRFASETATLTSVAQASCALLERSLRNVALLMGLPEDSIVVTPPKDLLDRTMSATEARDLMLVWQNGGISYQTFYERLQRGGIASDERDYEEELGLIDDRATDPSLTAQ